MDNTTEVAAPAVQTQKRPNPFEIHSKNLQALTVFFNNPENFREPVFLQDLVNRLEKSPSPITRQSIVSCLDSLERNGGFPRWLKMRAEAGGFRRRMFYVDVAYAKDLYKQQL